jgi:predicted DNA-binding WGR domain protein
MPTNAQLTEQLTAMTTRATDAETKLEKVTADLATANDRLSETKARKGYAERAARSTRSSVEQRELAGQLRAYKGSATKAQRPDHGPQS